MKMAFVLFIPVSSLSSEGVGGVTVRSSLVRETLSDDKEAYGRMV